MGKPPLRKRGGEHHAMKNRPQPTGDARSANSLVPIRKGAEEEIRRLVAKLEEQNAELIARNQELHRSEQKLLLQSTALETAANAVVITDVEGVILWVNPAFVALTGYTSEEAIGKSPRLLKSGRHDREFYKALWTTLLAGGAWRSSFTNRRKDGSLYHDEHTITPVRSKDGGITHFIAVMNDVTERKRAEEALRESEAELREAQRVAHVGSWQWITQTDTFTCSEEFCRIAGRDPKESHHYKDGQQIFAPESWARLEPAIERTLRTGIPIDLDLEIVRPDAARRWVAVRGEAIVDAAGEIVGLRGTVHDITERKRTETVLHEWEAELREAQRLAKVGSWKLAGETVTWSEEMHRIYGHDPALPPNPLRERAESYTSESWAQLQVVIEKATKTGMPFELELENVCPDGAHKWITARGEPIRDGEGRITALRGTVQDITERVGAEQRMRESEKRLAGIIGSATDGIVSVDEQQRITVFNAAAEKMFGYTASQILGQPLDRLIPEQFRTVHSRHMRNFEQTLATSPTMSTSATVLGLRANGETFPIEATMSLSDAGQQKLFTAILRDITERIRTEQTLQQQAKLFEQTYDAIIVWDWNGPITFWNRGAERLYGFSQREAVGRMGHQLMRTKFADGFEAFLHILEDRGSWEGELEHTTRDGQSIIVESRMMLVHQAEHVYGITINRDITARKRAEEEIRQLNSGLEQRVIERTAQLVERTKQLEVALKEIEAFAYSVSHDLRAPIRAMDGYSRILLGDYGEKVDEQGRRMLQVVRHEAKRMGVLVDDLLAFSRLSRQPMVSVDVDMTALARSVFDGLAALERDRELQFTLRPLPFIKGELAMLRQVWTNLLSNAIKFTKGREVAQIEIGAETGAEERIYYIKDNGAGFDMRFVGKLFGVFQRLHTDQEFPGTGVGLAIVQRVIARHGGRAWAEGKINEGATIYFAIPKAKI